MSTPLRPKRLYGGTPRTRYMSTPRTKIFARTPRTTPSYIRSAAKRRRVGTVRGKRRQTVADVVRDITQEKKRQEQLQIIPAVHNAEALLMGRNIAYDSDDVSGTLTRSGNNITITGISIKGHMQSQVYNIAAPGIRTAPTILRIYLCTTTRNDSPLNYWWQGLNTDTNEPNTFFPFTGLGDRDRAQHRINKLDIKILGRVSYKVTAPNFATVQNGHTVQINKFWKLNIPVHYNTQTTTPLPYNADQVRPNVWLVMFCWNPDTLSTAASSAVAGQFVNTIYFRE